MIRSLGAHLADDDVVVVEPAPVVERDCGAGVRLIEYVPAVHRLEAPAARQIVADQLCDIERCRGIRGRGERHHRDRNRFGLATRYFHHEFRPGLPAQNQGRDHGETGQLFIHWGLNSNTKVLWNRAGSGGSGSGDAR